MQKQLVGQAEAATLLGIKEHTLAVWRCTKRYDLPWVKVGRSVRYRLEDLQGFIAKRTAGGTQ